MSEKVKFLYNPESGEVFNATPLTLKNMHKLKLVVCPEAVLREKRPELFEGGKVPAGVAPNPEPAPDIKDLLARMKALEDENAMLRDAAAGSAGATAADSAEDYLDTSALETQDQGAADGVVMDPNRLTLLVEGIEKLDPATDFTASGVPNPAKLSAATESKVTAIERDMAWAEYQRLQQDGVDA